MKLHIVDLGTVDYQEAFALQNHLLGLRQRGETEDILLLLEHPPVLTIGRSGSRSNLRLSEEALLSQGVNIYDVNRGGDITYHGPGQIVGYPIVDLSVLGRDVRAFVRNIEEIFIRLLASEYGIEAGRDPRHTGVWVGEDKITAIGLAVKRWVTQHGFAFNVNTDLRHFDWIVPCGITDKGVTSMERLLGEPQHLPRVKSQVADYFGQVFGWETTPMDKEAVWERYRPLQQSER